MQTKRFWKDPLYPYSYEDKSTWAYLDCKISGKGKNRQIEWIKNPKFKYAHLVKGY